MTLKPRLNGLARLILAASDKSQRGIGRMLTVSRCRASRILAGERGIDGPDLKSLSTALDCPADLLVAPVRSRVQLASLFLAWTTLQANHNHVQQADS